MAKGHRQYNGTKSLYIVELAIWGPLSLNINFGIGLQIFTKELAGIMVLKNIQKKNKESRHRFYIFHKY